VVVTSGLLEQKIKGCHGKNSFVISGYNNQFLYTIGFTHNFSTIGKLNENRR
jgi:hypothetical protein